MPAEILLSRLQKVRRTGKGRWMACCPAHQDRSASLSIREMEDGRVLLHCFAACQVADVLAAVGLSFHDLMPNRIEGEHKAIRHAFSAFDALKALALECLFIELCARRLAKAQSLDSQDLDRLVVAAGRVRAAVVAVGGES